MLDELLRDPRVGKSAPVTMALVLRLAAALLARRDLDPIARAALRLIELAAADAFAASLGEELVGSRSTDETKQRAEALWALTGVPGEVVVEADSKHAPLLSSAAKVADPRQTVERIGDALYHLRWTAKRNTLMLTQRVVQGIVIDRLTRNAMKLQAPDVDVPHLIRAVAESLAPDLGCVPEESLVVRCLSGLANDHAKWEPLAELFSLSGVRIDPESARKNYRRYSEDKSSE